MEKKTLPSKFDRENFVYKDVKIRMSQKAMADLMYAIIACHAGVPTTWSLAVDDCTRKENSYNMADIKIHIHPYYFAKFELLAGVKLENPIQIQMPNTYR